MKEGIRGESPPAQPNPFLPSSSDGYIQSPCLQNPFALPPSAEELDALQPNLVNPFPLPPAITADESSTLQQHASVLKNPFLFSQQHGASSAGHHGTATGTQDLFVIPSLASSTQRIKPVIQLDPSSPPLNDLLLGLSNVVANANCNSNIQASAESLKVAKVIVGVNEQTEGELSSRSMILEAPKSGDGEKTTTATSEVDKPYLARLFGGKKEKAGAAAMGGSQTKKWIKIPKMDPKGSWPQGWY